MTDNSNPTPSPDAESSSEAIVDNRRSVDLSGCNLQMTLLIIVPVFACAILALLSPIIRPILAEQESQRRCDGYIEESLPLVINETVFSDEADSTGTVITAENVANIVELGEVSFPVDDRHIVPAVNHPNGDYAIYGDYRETLATRFFVCAPDGDALGAFTADASTGDVVFNADGSRFAIGDGRFGRIVVFDGEAVERLEFFDVREDGENERFIESVAFHPTQSLLFFTALDTLYVWETETFTEVTRFEGIPTENREIGFNAQGTQVYLVDFETDNGIAWGISQ